MVCCLGSSTALPIHRHLGGGTPNGNSPSTSVYSQGNTFLKTVKACFILKSRSGYWGLFDEDVQIWSVVVCISFECITKGSQVEFGPQCGTVNRWWEVWVQASLEAIISPFLWPIVLLLQHSGHDAVMRWCSQKVAPSADQIPCLLDCQLQNCELIKNIFFCKHHLRYFIIASANGLILLSYLCTFIFHTCNCLKYFLFIYLGTVLLQLLNTVKKTQEDKVQCIYT